MTQCFWKTSKPKETACSTKSFGTKDTLDLIHKVKALPSLPPDSWCTGPPISFLPIITNYGQHALPQSVFDITHCGINFQLVSWKWVADASAAITLPLKASEPRWTDYTKWLEQGIVYQLAILLNFSLSSSYIPKDCAHRVGLGMYHASTRYI